MDKMYCIYMHISPEGLRYIGKTSRKPIQRWTQGNKYRGNKDFYNAIAKYGENNFLSVFEHFYLDAGKKSWMLWHRDLPVKVTNVFSYEEAEQLEKAWIAIFDTMNPEKGFNRASGGERDFYISPISKAYNREAHADFDYSGENNPFYGKEHSDETKALLKHLASLRIGEKNSFYGRRHTQEAKERNRQAHLGLYDGEKNPFYGKQHSEKTKDRISAKHNKPISAYALDGSYVKTFPSALVAAEEMDVSVQTISMCATKATKTSCGMIWRYFKCTQLPEDELPKKHALCKTVAQYNLQGEFVKTFDSLTEAAKSARTTIQNISQCVNGRFKQAGGYIWRDFACDFLPSNDFPVRKKRCRAVDQYDSQGNYIKTYGSLKEAATALGVTPEAICNAAKGKIKMCAGFAWKYSQ